MMFFGGVSLAIHSQDIRPLENQNGSSRVILTNPTVPTIELISFLTDHHIFKINKNKVRFTGVYHQNQAYDFRKSRELIRDKKLTNFSLIEVTGEIGVDDVFKTNHCSEQFREIFNQSDGIIFFGGPDIQPEMYGEENTHSVVTDPARHNFEVSFLFHLLGGSRDPEFVPFLNEQPDYLVTGFCLGIQSMNVATGGTLVQDIPFQVYGKKTPEETVTIPATDLHRNYWQEISDDKQLMGIHFHGLYPVDHPFFRQKVRIREPFHPMVYSSHHQSIEVIGTGFEVTALSHDGKVIEGLAHKQFRNVFGVQFHPEVPALYENRELWKFTPDDKPRTYHHIIGRKSVAFHKNYWKRISDGLAESAKQTRK
jgi:putative glutamine amidotransferase